MVRSYFDAPSECTDVVGTDTSVHSDGAFILRRRQSRDVRRLSRDARRLSRDARRLSRDTRRQSQQISPCCCYTFFISENISMSTHADARMPIMLCFVHFQNK